MRARQDTLRDARRQLIVDAARRVFERVGLEGASIRMIAAEAGCTTGAIYPWFAGKEEIYAAILAESLDRLARFMSQRVAAKPDPLERARASVEAFYRYYQKNPDELWLGLYLFRSRGVQPTGLKPELDRDLNSRLAAALDIMAKAIAEAGFDEPGERAAAAMVYASGLLVYMGAGRMKVLGARPDDLIRRYIEDALPQRSSDPQR